MRGLANAALREEGAAGVKEQLKQLLAVSNRCAAPMPLPPTIPTVLALACIGGMLQFCMPYCGFRSQVMGVLA